MQRSPVFSVEKRKKRKKRGRLMKPLQRTITHQLVALCCGHRPHRRWPVLRMERHTAPRDERSRRLCPHLAVDFCRFRSHPEVDLLRPQKGSKTIIQRVRNSQASRSQRLRSASMVARGSFFCFFEV